MKEGRYFTIEEMTRSYTADRNHIDNTPGTYELNNLYILIDQLDEIRKDFGGPININSGYRCDELNKLVGGSKTSHHKFGMAADLDTEDNVRLFHLIRNNYKFTELVAENAKFDSDNQLCYIGWIHFAYDKYNLKNKIKYR